MSWYDEMKNSDWFAATKDVADGLGNLYEKTKHQSAPEQQKQVLTQLESDQNVQAKTWDIKKDAPKLFSNVPNSYLIVGSAILGVAVLAFALRG